MQTADTVLGIKFNLLKSFEKGENAGNQRFHLFPQYFLSFVKQISIFESFIVLAANAFNLEESLILSLVKS